jgi:hypothetical protein
MKLFCKGCFPNTMHLPPPPLPDKKFPCGGSKIGDKDFYEVVDLVSSTLRHFNIIFEDRILKKT